MNEYLKDASIFLKRAASLLEEDMPREVILGAILHLALGMERVLKGILFNLNPVYVYKSQEFKNTVSLLYEDKLLPNASHNREIAKEPDADVLTFKLSLLRAKSISRTTDRHISLLFSLSNLRDIIAHNRLSLFDVEKARILLLRDFYPLVRDYSDELGVSTASLIGSYDIRLASISAMYQESIADQVRVRLESHRKRWEQLKEMPGFIEKMYRKMEMLRARESVEIVDCPACENDALLYIEPEYDYVDGESLIRGIFVSGLKCLFCKLEIEDYHVIDFLELDKVLFPDEGIW